MTTFDEIISELDKELREKEADAKRLCDDARKAAEVYGNNHQGLTLQLLAAILERM